MSAEKATKVKSRLHSRNRNRERYDLEALIQVVPDLAKHLVPNKLGEESIDFSKPLAVKMLNQALLKHYYQINHWDFPNENLCPPIPGRADYLHYMADLLAESNFGRLPNGDNIKALDVGVGASCIYPIIGVTEYDWQFVGFDIDTKSIASAQSIIDANPVLKNKVELRLQKNPDEIFTGIVGKEEKFDISICNPPFHSSMEEALKETRRKIKNLTGQKAATPERNFSGVSHELIYAGGEVKFIQDTVGESARFPKNCFWFSTLVSKQSNLNGLYKMLENIGVMDMKTIPMGTGNKSSRIVAWTFLSNAEQKNWKTSRWM